jgi:hypothetical protein
VELIKVWRARQKQGKAPRTTRVILETESPVFFKSIDVIRPQLASGLQENQAV